MFFYWPKFPALCLENLGRQRHRSRHAEVTRWPAMVPAKILKGRPAPYGGRDWGNGDSRRGRPRVSSAHPRRGSLQAGSSDLKKQKTGRNLAASVTTARHGQGPGAGRCARRGFWFRVVARLVLVVAGRRGDDLDGARIPDSGGGGPRRARCTRGFLHERASCRRGHGCKRRKSSTSVDGLQGPSRIASKEATDRWRIAARVGCPALARLRTSCHARQKGRTL